MQYVRVFGVDYYYDASVVPYFVQYAMRILVGRFGNDLDATAPEWAQYRANFLMKKWGALNV